MDWSTERRRINKAVDAVPEGELRARLREFALENQRLRIILEGAATQTGETWGLIEVQAIERGEDRGVTGLLVCSPGDEEALATRLLADFGRHFGIAARRGEPQRRQRHEEGERVMGASEETLDDVVTVQDAVEQILAAVARMEHREGEVRARTEATVRAARAWEIDHLHAILDGRAEPPTDEELAAHDGSWLVSRSDGYATVATSYLARALRDAGAGVRWWALAVGGRPCAWPEVR